MDGNSLTTLVQMVAAGFGVTLIPEMAAEFEGRIPNISIAKFHKNPPTLVADPQIRLAPIHLVLAHL